MHIIDLKDSPLRSLADLMKRRVEQTPEELAYQIRVEGEWHDMSWQTFGSQVNHIAGGLLELGVSRGDRCAILMSTRVEWIAVDFGVLAAGGATTTIYQSSTPEECRYILADSGAKACFVEDEGQLEKILEVRDQLPELLAIVIVDGASEVEGVYSLSELEKMGAGHGEKVVSSVEALAPDDLACLIYTSGTTGVPKGVMLTHGNFLQIAKGVDDLAQHYHDEKQLLFLPLAHVFGKVCELTSVYLGVPTAIDGDLNRLVEALGEVQPTIIAAVPRVFEKCFNTVIRKARSAGPRKFRVFQWALKIGREVSRHRQENRALPFLLRVQFNVADKLVFSKVRQVFGGELRHCVSGGAPLAREVAEFFHASGILILEGYGLTETSAVTTLNEPDAFKFGTVGRPAPGVELKIADDGEILIRSPAVMVGYYGKEEATAEAIRDGWFHSGDIGTIDGEGFLKITDRKKNLIITSGGKNIAPQKIENLLKASTDVVSQALVHGDQRNFCVALLTLDPESVTSWCASKGVDVGLDFSKNPDLKRHLMTHVEQVNETLPRHETIKDILVLDQEFSVESGELTQSMKMRRAVIEANYKSALDKFYLGSVELSAT